MKILTFDIEEWFHILDHKQTKGVKEWSSFESRIHSNMDRIFKIIDENNKNATFFVVGWIAEKYPEIIREIARKGFEVGSHTHLHQLIYNQNPSSFKADVEKSIKTIEDCIGKKVKSFRAPGFSITNTNKWAFEILFELGIKNDSSVFPAKRAHGGFPSYFESKPSILKYNGATLKEFPINTVSFMNRDFIFSGGGYFRILPYSFIKKLTQNSDYIMTYFHPRDFDYNQPVIPGLSKIRKFRTYVGIKGCENKLRKWINDFDFIDLNTADKMINWNNKKIIEL